MTPPIHTGALIALLMGAQACGAEELGRLFYTPAERAQLDYGKLQNTDPRNSRGVLTVNGIVQKRGGGRTVWINGVPQNAGASDERSPESLPVAVPGQKTPVKVKVGQKVLVAPAAGSGK
ncbi:hypothetical protein FGKAn22_18930 [Ferrigenium kumadai]|uniref:Uncharacterized protein n=1 Tax=Ferrigenium kumadai TaxID=1682490 RepID=A0AAN1T1F5_9PROT|nr:hypothetical protein [Ferrigenium kumadai]BBJ00201.1 hypothetical protein FGKAn22_18930 [Ferrigenium kumadai]